MMKNQSKKDEGGCVKCGTCNTVCPVYLITGNEINTPRGKQHLGVNLLKGERSSHFEEIFSKCLLCGACLEVCPRGLDTPQLVIDIRSELPKLSGLSFLKYVSRKALTSPALLSGLSKVGTAANSIFGEMLPSDSGLRLRLLGFEEGRLSLPDESFIDRCKKESVSGGGADTITEALELNYFTGCLANHMQPEIAESTQFILSEIDGQKARVALEQTCCGMAALAAGKADEARDLAKKNIRAFEGNDNPILTSCSSCYYHLKSYSSLFENDPEWHERAQSFTGRLQEFSTFFLNRLSAQESLPDASQTPKKKVYYHDPCHLRFKLNITREPRQLLRLLAVELHELPTGPQCCGQGGLFQIAHPDLAIQVHEKLMTEFKELDAETVVTACSGCLLQWQQGLNSDKSPAQAIHLAVFIARLIQ
jgi:glycolate oxidase iron-sulfur subunit